MILVHYTETQSLIRWGLRFTACMAYATLHHATLSKLGWFGAIQYPITTPKILGIATLVIAILINQLDTNYFHKNVN